jgi:DNA polymerase I-like protein with 3'-5' exonuclease and polymerase domains
MSTLTFDFETNTVMKGNPFTASGKAITYSVKVEGGEVTNSYFTDIDFPKLLRESIGKAKLLVGFNIKYDLHWARRLGVLPPEGVRVWDCQIAEFLIRGQQGPYPSLNEALTRFDLGQKDDKVAEYWKLGIDTEFIPPVELKFYCDLDVELTYKLYLKQQEVMPIPLKRLCMVMGLDLLVLEEMEWNGVKYDVEQSKAKAETTKKELTEVTAELYTLLGVSNVNLDSGHQLSCVLYGGAFEVTVPDRVEKLIYKSGKREGEEYDRTYWKTNTIQCERLFVPLKGSETKLVSKTADAEYPIYATGEDVLKQLRKPSFRHRRIIDLLLLRAEKEKLVSTYYAALPVLLEKMEWGDLLHGQLNQVVARTGRLSSNQPNMQNFSADVDELIVSRYE